MRTKRVFFSAMLAGFFFVSFGQTSEAIKKEIEYEKYATARSLAEKMTAQPNANPDAWYWLGELYMLDSNLVKAAEILKEGIGYASSHSFSSKTSPLIVAGQAHLLLEEGKAAEARAGMESLLEESRYKDPVALLAVAKANIESKQGDIAWAVELLNKAIKRDKHNADLYIALGDAYRRQLDGGNAVINYKKALEESNNTKAVAFHKIGEIYKTQNNPELYLGYFQQAAEADKNFAPALYELYVYYYYRDVVKAKTYLDRYIASSDPSPAHAYMIADLHYVSQQYPEAIQVAQQIIDREKDKVKQPRIYKLAAYSYAYTGDSATALTYMNDYFARENPASFVAKDYELEAKLLDKLDTNKQYVVDWYQKALAVSDNKKDSLAYIILLANKEHERKNYVQEAHWRKVNYRVKNSPNNLDLYKWGIALYQGANYPAADTVFALYQEKYPDHLHGYLMRAACNSLMDTTMTQGLAVPHYQQLITVASADSLANKQVLLRAYGYLGTYEANITKDYEKSLFYFDKILELDPANADARQYVSILQKWVDKDVKGSK